MADTAVLITPEAERTLGDMRRRVDDIGMEYGRYSEEYLKVTFSLLDALMGIMRLGGRISRDGDLALFGASFIAYGVIWFPKRNGDERDPLLGDWSIHS